LTIILECLKRRGFTVRAIDINEPFEMFNFDQSFGILLNIPIERPVFDRLPLLRSLASGRHWLTIKNVDGIYYDFDSKLHEPKLIGQRERLISYLKTFDKKKVYMYIVIEQSLADEYAQKI